MLLETRMLVCCSDVIFVEASSFQLTTQMVITFFCHTPNLLDFIHIKDENILQLSYLLASNEKLGVLLITLLNKKERSLFK